MKIKFLTFMVVTSFLISCKNNDSIVSSSEEHYKKATNEWLIKKIGNGQSISEGILKSIKSSLELDKLWISNYYGDRKIITIPMSDSYVSKNNHNKSPKNYLVVFTNNNGVIESGYVWQLLPNSEMSKNTISNLYNHIDENLNGNYTILDLKDNFIVQYVYNNNKLQEQFTRNMKKPDTQVNNSGTLVCTEYYVLHTVYEIGTGNIVNQEVLYTFQSCTCTPNNMVQTTIIGPTECDPTLSGGGGTSYTPPINVQKVVDRIVASSAIHGNFTVRSIEELKGIKGIEPTLDRPWDKEFTSITHLSHPYSTKTTYNDQTGVYVPYITSLSSIAVSTYVNIQAANRYISGQINLGLGGSTVFSDPYTWVFFVEFP